MNLDQRLRAADPARHVAGYTPEVAETILSRITTTPTRTRPWARWISLAAAAVLAVALVVVPGLGLFRGGATAEAAGLLDKAIANAVDPPAGPDQYWKTTSSGTVLHGVDAGNEYAAAWFVQEVRSISYRPVDDTRPMWSVSSEGPYLRQVDGPSIPPPASGWTDQAWTSDRPLNQERTYTDIMGLPTEPGALRAELYRLTAGAGNSTDGAVFEYALEVLGNGSTPAALRKALYQVIKTIPGVEVVDHDVTLDGRAGIGLGRLELSTYETKYQYRDELVLDPGTAQIIGTRTVYPNLDFTTEVVITRELVDQVDRDVVRTATRCQATPEGMLACPAR